MLNYSYSFNYYSIPYGNGREQMAIQKTLYDQLLPGQEVFGSFEAAAAMHFKNYLSVQALDEIKKTGATIIINYKKIRLDVDENIWRNGETGTHS